MRKDIERLGQHDVEDVLTELDKAFYDIPFENSNFQNLAFVMAAQQTPGRAYRAIGLRMFSKIRAIKANMYNQRRAAIALEEKQAKVDDAATDAYERRQLQVDLDEAADGEAWGDKLLNDALQELTCLYTEFKKFPAYTREAFEIEETAHFEQRLVRDSQSSGAQTSLTNMKVDLPNWDALLETTQSLLEAHNLLAKE